MTRWWWLRHGPTHEPGLVGWRDVPADLSDTAAIDRLRAYLPARAALTSSDLLRASATADAVALPDHDRLPPVPDLREFNFGEWDGLGFDEVVRRAPDLALAFWEAPGEVRAPGGENWNELAARVRGWVDRFNQARDRPRDIIVVAHFGVILTQLQNALGQSPKEVLAHRIDNLSVTRLDWDGQGWQVGEINHRP